jgi:hypothetical protein
VRDHGLLAHASAADVAAWGQVAAAGLSFDWLTGANISGTLGGADAFLSAHPGGIAAIEGPNEINNFPLAYAGLSGVAAAQAYQSALWNAVEADPLTAGLPVLSFTGAGMAPTGANAANLHYYPTAGAQPLAGLAAALAVLARQMPGAPVYITEAGYFTLPGMHAWEGVDNATQAKLTLNLIMDAAKLGVKALYLYDLIDDGPDPSGKNACDHFGLFTTSGQAKPVAAAIHNLTSILADSGANAASFKTAPLNVQLSGMPASGSSLVIETSSGAYDIILWAEPTVWNAATHKPVAAAPQTVTVSFPTTYASVKLYDPLVSATPTGPASVSKAASGASAVSLSLSDHPVILQVSNFVQAMSSAGSASSAALTATQSATPPTQVSVLAKP